MPSHRVLITGANGLLGQALTDALTGAGEPEILATSRDDESFHPSSPPHETLDITNEADVRGVVSDFAPDVVVNCAALTQVDDCEVRQEACRRVNADAVKSLAKTCEAFDAHLVHVSTDFVFDGSSGPYQETDDPNPVNYYGMSKLLGERAIQDSALERWTIARTVLVYGTGHRLKRSNIALWLIDELSNGHSVSIVTDQWRTPTYVPDLAEGIRRIVDRGATGVYHLSGADGMSIYDFAHHITDVFGFDTSLVERTTSEALDQTARRPPRTGFIINKARRDLGFDPHSITPALQTLGQELDLSTRA